VRGTEGPGGGVGGHGVAVAAPRRARECGRLSSGAEGGGVHLIEALAPPQRTEVGEMTVVAEVGGDESGGALAVGGEHTLGTVRIDGAQRN